MGLLGKPNVLLHDCLGRLVEAKGALEQHRELLSHHAVKKRSAEPLTVFRETHEVGRPLGLKSLSMSVMLANAKQTSRSSVVQTGTGQGNVNALRTESKIHLPAGQGLWRIRCS